MNQKAGYSEGTAEAWAFRWMSACRPGCYVVTLKADSFVENFNAVVDDFGNLVRVH